MNKICKPFVLILLLTLAKSGFCQYLQVEGYWSAPDVDLRVIVLDNQKGIIAAHTSLAAGNCGGEIAGIGQVSGRTVQIFPYVKESKAPNCSVRIEFDPKFKKAKIESDGDCAYYSGAACTWEGQSMTKQKIKN